MDNLNQSERLLFEIIRDLGPVYSNPIMKEFDNRTGETSNGAQIYFALKNLEKKEYIESWLGEATKERGGRPKRYYQITDKFIPFDIGDEKEVAVEPIPEKVQEPKVPANGIYIL